MPSRKKIAVIGAGAAGLVSLDTLRAAGHEVTVFERRTRVGGLWTDHYEALHLITTSKVSQFPGFPQPADHPDYPSRAQVSAYMQSYAEKRDLLKDIRFGVEVLNVEPSDDSRGLNGWTVTSTFTPEQEHFDAVVVANGHLHHKFVPELPGTFDGKVIHSGDYKTAADIEGERVLVLGAGNSGCDLATDAAQNRKAVTLSIRGAFTFIPKALFGRPRPELPTSKLPPVIAEKINRFLVRVSVGRPEQYPGVPKPASRNLRKWRPIVNDLVPYWIMHGRIAVKPSLAKLAGKTATFSDGTSADFDTILLATGFRYHAPFLAENVVPRDNDMPRRWAADMLTDSAANLFFIGLVAPAGAQWPIYGIQASLIAPMLAAQDRSTDPIVREFQREDEGFGGLELLPELWFKKLKLTRKTLKRLQG